MPTQQTVEPRKGREGGRWINERPTSEEFAEWFSSSMAIDEKLRVEDYIGGVVLIPAVDERARVVTGFNQSTGEPIIAQRPEMSYIPYAKVETRVAYFWDYLNAHEELVGVVEHVVSPRMPIDFVNVVEKRDASDHGWTSRELRTPSALTSLVHQLPEGYSITSVPVGNAYTHFLCCTIRVSIYDREEYKADRNRALPRRTGRGTKQVPLLMGRRDPYADPNSLMKAETGALGRALGFAGVFVIPGSGVATAEDMMESMAQGQPPAETDPGNAGPAAPPESPARTGAEQAQDEETQLRSRAGQLYRQLSEESPERATQFGAWMRERRHNSFAEVKGAALRGVVKKLEKQIEEAGQQSGEGESDVPDVPATPAEPSPEAG